MATDSIARALALEAGQGGEPESYLKDADVDGNTLILVKKKGDVTKKIEYAPEAEDVYLDSVYLKNDLYAYADIGKVKATAANPVLLGKKDESLLVVFNKMFGLEIIQPTIFKQPSITLSVTSSASDEYGTSISSVTGTITTTDGQYDCAGVKQNANVTWSNYLISSSLGSLSERTGTIILSTPYIVGQSSAIAFTAKATNSEGEPAKDNTGAPTSLRIPSEERSASFSFSKALHNYPYYTTGTSTPTTGTKSVDALINGTGTDVPYTAQQYLYIYIAKGTESSQPSKKIQVYNDLTGWADFSGGTTNIGYVSFKQANNVNRDYWCYRTATVSQSSGSAKIRLQ